MRQGAEDGSAAASSTGNELAFDADATFGRPLVIRNAHCALVDRFVAGVDRGYRCRTQKREHFTYRAAPVLVKTVLITSERNRSDDGRFSGSEARKTHQQRSRFRSLLPQGKDDRFEPVLKLWIGSNGEIGLLCSNADQWNAKRILLRLTQSVPGAMQCYFLAVFVCHRSWSPQMLTGQKHAIAAHLAGLNGDSCSVVP